MSIFLLRIAQYPHFQITRLINFWITAAKAYFQYDGSARNMTSMASQRIKRAWHHLYCNWFAAPNGSYVRHLIDAVFLTEM